MLKILAAAIALLVATAHAAFAGEHAEDQALSEPTLEKIADGVWVHKSWNVIEPWGLVLSQGLVVKTEGGVVLVDTAWNDADTEKLLTLIKAETGALPTTAIVTHAHSDKMGGMGALKRHNIATSAHVFSNEDAPARGLLPADESLFTDDKNSLLVIGAHSGFHYEAFYPGPGHTRDNIVVYYAPAKVLFGGCLIRPGQSGDLGNTADGDVRHWAQAVKNVAEAFPDAEIVIPSHGAMGGRNLLDHTIALAEEAAAKLK
ncbi:MAG: subclass B1 metallo-beta-lactamase [Parvularculaceae bacterium]